MSRSAAALSSLARHKAQRLADHPDALTIESVLDLCGQLRTLAGDLPDVAALIADIEAWATAKRDRRVTDNMGLIYHMVHRKYEKSLEVMAIPEADAMQEGAVGLLRAANLYDEAKGFAFSTYATWWIRQAIQRLLQNDSTIHVPPHRQREAYYAGEKEPARMCLSLDASWENAEQDYGSMKDFAVDKHAEGEERRATARMDLAALMGCLTEKRRVVIECRLAGMTLNETADALAEQGHARLTRERIRQIECKALEAMRNRGQVLHEINRKRRRA